MSEKVRAHTIISGKVQGVFFRKETQDAASRHGVNGWVRNKADGTVEAVFEGDKSDVKSVLDWCKQGPPASQVEDVRVDWQDFTGEFSSFNIKY